MRVDEPSLSSPTDVYDWAVQNTTFFAIGLRKFWIAWRRNDDTVCTLLRTIGRHAWSYEHTDTAGSICHNHGPHKRNGAEESDSLRDAAKVGRARRHFHHLAGGPTCSWCGSVAHMLDKTKFGCSKAGLNSNGSPGFVWKREASGESRPGLQHDKPAA